MTTPTPDSLHDSVPHGAPPAAAPAPATGPAAGAVAPAAAAAPPLHIALVGPLPPPAGGMANQTLQLRQLLQDDGHRVDLVRVNAPYAPAWVGRLRGVRAAFRLLPYLRALWHAAGRVQLMHVMANSGWSWHLYAAPAIWIARWRGCPIVVNYRGGEAGAFLQRSHAVVGASLRRADALLVPSGFLAAVFGQYGFSAAIVPNVVNLERFSAAPDLPFSTAGGPGPCVLVARNLEAIYDNASALRAFARVLAAHPRARLVLAGSGPLRAALEQLAAELGIAAAVTFTGRVDPVRMAELCRQADIMLNPSLADNMPNSVLEALASGVPVVSTDVGGVPYLVQDGRTALLVPARDPAAMAAAMLRLLAEPALAQALRTAGLRTVQQYTWRQVRPQLLQAYHAALGASPFSSRQRVRP